MNVCLFNMCIHSYLTGFPQVVGLIDGTQIPIVAPYKNPEQYVNRHGDFSLATQIVVNHRGAITHLSCRWPGSVHDSRILQESCLQGVLDRHMLGRYFLLGDTGYHCQTNLITPYDIPLTEQHFQ